METLPYRTILLPSPWRTTAIRAAGCFFARGGSIPVSEIPSSWQKSAFGVFGLAQAAPPARFSKLGLAQVAPLGPLGLAQVAQLGLAQV